MQKSKNAHEETVRIMQNLLLQNLEFGLNKPIFIDCLGDGRSVATKLIDDHPLIELTRLEATRLKICRLSQQKKIAQKVMQKKIAQKVMRKRLFYGASLYVKYLFQEWLLRLIQTSKWLLK